jgi:putative transcriptional regulator
MDKNSFEELVGSLKEAKAIAKGRTKPSRRFETAPPDAKAVREQTGLSPTLDRMARNLQSRTT